tara:strand:- start:4486 stop:4914 length:429 start_codon:yes stop_codon:yes gene_type:complete
MHPNLYLAIDVQKDYHFYFNKVSDNWTKEIDNQLLEVLMTKGVITKSEEKCIVFSLLPTGGLVITVEEQKGYEAKIEFNNENLLNLFKYLCNKVVGNVVTHGFIYIPKAGWKPGETNYKIIDLDDYDKIFIESIDYIISRKI